MSFTSRLYTELTTEQRVVLYFYDLNDPNTEARETNYLPIECVLSKKTSRRAVMTKNPIESGFNIIDSGRVEPVSITLDCIVSEFPYESDKFLQLNDSIDILDPSGVARLQQEISLGEQGLYAELADAARNRLDLYDAWFSFLLEPHIALILITPNGEIPSLKVTSYERDESISSSGGLKFNLTLEEILIVNTEEVELGETRKYTPAKPKAPSKSVKKAKEEKAKLEAEKKAEAEKQKQSFLSILAEQAAKLMTGG